MTEQATMTEQEKKNESTRKMQQLLVRAMKDEAWREELLTNPKTPIERELGITFPQGVTIQVHEETPTTVHLVLPPRQLGAVEVSDADLMAQADDTDYGTAWPKCCCVCSHTVAVTVSVC